MQDAPEQRHGKPEFRDQPRAGVLRRRHGCEVDAPCGHHPSLEPPRVAVVAKRMSSFLDGLSHGERWVDVASRSSTCQHHRAPRVLHPMPPCGSPATGPLPAAPRYRTPPAPATRLRMAVAADARYLPVMKSTSKGVFLWVFLLLVLALAFAMVGGGASGRDQLELPTRK